MRFEYPRVSAEKDFKNTMGRTGMVALATCLVIGGSPDAVAQTADQSSQATATSIQDAAGLRFNIPALPLSRPSAPSAGKAAFR